MVLCVCVSVCVGGGTHIRVWDGVLSLDGVGLQTRGRHQLGEPGFECETMQCEALTTFHHSDPVELNKKYTGGEGQPDNSHVTR